MAKFIRVSEVFNDVVKTVLINVDTIEHIKVGNKGTDTFIKLITPSPEFEKRQGFFFVQETVEQIEQQLGIGLATAPVIMTADEYTKATGYQRDMGHRARSPADLKSAGLV